MTTPDQPSPHSTGSDPADQRPAALDERVDAALDVCDDLLKVLPQLVRRLDKLEQAQPTPAAGERRSDFRFESYPVPTSDDEHAKQQRQVRQAWQRLAGWVDWLAATYRLTSVIPACWPEHPVIVEELKALFVAWVGAWLDSAGPDAPAAWQRRLHDAKARLADGNWGTPRCDGHHDGTGLDLADHYDSWQASSARDKALIAARDRSLAALANSGEGGGR